MELRTLGRLALFDESGASFASILAHPKRIALLAYLAAAPAGFHRRDILLGLLWPELDQERARASLRKAVYHIRRALGEDIIVNRGDDELALEHDRIDCDVVNFNNAVDRGDAAAALAIYRGPFLDGLFIPDAPEFEDWQARERKRLHERAFAAAWQLTEAAERSGDAFAAAEAARRAAELMPDDEAALRKVMMLLDRIGDRAGSLSVYEEFARRISRDFDAEPSTETKTLAAGLRRSDVVEDYSAPPSPVVKQSVRLPRRRAIAGIALIAVMLVAAVSGVQFVPASVKGSARSIAVLPFAYRGHDELAYLGEGMVNLLATNLDQIGDFRTIDAAAVLNQTDGLHNIDAINGANVALRLGAGLIVRGDIVEANGRLRVSAGLYEAREPSRARARASAEGDVANLFEIIDAVTSQLIAGDRRAPAERFTRLALLTTHSVPALKAYLQGEQLFRDGRYNEAVESFQKAVEADTTFALGYYRLALAHMWGSNDSDRVAAERAIAHGQRLAGPERALLDALLPFFRGDVDEAERQYRAILVTRPEESEVWYPLGEVLFHHNSSRGRHAREARMPFEKALALGPKDGPLTHLVEIAAIERDYVAFDSLFTGIQPASHFYYVGELVQAFRSGNTQERERVLNALRDSSDSRLVTAARHAMFLMEEAEHSAPVLDLLVAKNRPRAVRSWGYIHRAHLALGQGLLARAQLEFAHATPLDAVRALEHEAWLSSFPFMNTSISELRRLRDRLERLPQTSPPSEKTGELVLNADVEIEPHIRVYLIGILSALIGDYAAAERAAAALPRMAGTELARDLAINLSHAVRAEVLRLQGNQQGALNELQRERKTFDANRNNVSPFVSEVRERYVRAGLLRTLGREEEALGWYESFDEHAPWGRAVLAPAAFEQAQIYEELKRYDDAKRHYARFINLYKDAEPPFQARVTHAKQRLALLQRLN